MDRTTLDFLCAKQTPRHFEPGEIIFSQGEAATEFYYLLSGLSLTYTIFEDGRERNILISWPDRIFGASTFFEKVPRRASAIAIRPCEVLVIDRVLYNACCAAFPTFPETLLAEVSKDMGVLFDELADVSMINSDVRVARFLCRRLATGQHEGSADEALFPFTQDFIANVLGISRASVNQSLAHLSAEGWIETRYGRIRLRNAKALREYAYG